MTMLQLVFSIGMGLLMLLLLPLAWPRNWGGWGTILDVPGFGPAVLQCCVMALFFFAYAVIVCWRLRRGEPGWKTGALRRHSLVLALTGAIFGVPVLLATASVYLPGLLSEQPQTGRLLWIVPLSAVIPLSIWQIHYYLTDSDRRRFAELRRLEKEGHRLCRVCGYIVDHLPDFSRCPECATPVEPAEGRSGPGARATSHAPGSHTDKPQR